MLPLFRPRSTRAQPFRELPFARYYAGLPFKISCTVMLFEAGSSTPLYRGRNMAEVRFMRASMLILAAVFAASLLLVIFSAPGAEAQTTTTGVLTGTKVVPDAGHRGSDPGASNVAYNLKEKDQDLDLAYKLKALLETSGTTVYMTRTGEQPSPTTIATSSPTPRGPTFLSRSTQTVRRTPARTTRPPCMTSGRSTRSSPYACSTGSEPCRRPRGRAPSPRGRPTSTLRACCSGATCPRPSRRACSLPTAMRGGFSPKAPEPDSSR